MLYSTHIQHVRLQQKKSDQKSTTLTFKKIRKIDPFTFIGGAAQYCVSKVINTTRTIIDKKGNLRLMMCVCVCGVEGKVHPSYCVCMYINNIASFYVLRNIPTK